MLEVMTELEEKGGAVWWWLEQDKEIILREGDWQDLCLYSTAKQINKWERVTKTAYTFLSMIVHKTSLL